MSTVLANWDYGQDYTWNMINNMYYGPGTTGCLSSWSSSVVIPAWTRIGLYTMDIAIVICENYTVCQQNIVDIFHCFAVPCY